MDREDQSKIEREQAFRQLVTTHTPYMRIVACTIVGQLQADDVVQEAWVSIYKGLPKFQHRSSLKTWITTITANEAKNYLRKQSRSPLLESLTDEHGEVMQERFDKSGRWSRPFAPWHTETPEALLCNDQLTDYMQRAIEQLPEQQRIALQLKECNGMSLNEICNILEVSPSNVRVLIHRARHKLLEQVENFR
ncbi:MAG: RNA polymerase sigma factor [Candidatus Polarisedimenticolaceae bacterium]|nr:RNA polymerase sigma factor [Candidatus Polarisedimenticolaceae bacterium]